MFAATEGAEGWARVALTDGDGRDVRSQPERRSLGSRLVAFVVPRGRLGRSVALLVGGTATAQAIYALTSPLLTRLYGPADFGVLSVYQAALGILGVVVGLRYMLAIPLQKDGPDVANVATLTLALGTVMSAAFGAIGIAFAEPITEALHVPQLAPYMWVLPLSLAGGVLYQVMYFWAIREQGFSVIARTRVAQSGSRAGVQLLLGVAGVAPLGLLLGDLAEDVAGCASFGRLLRAQLPPAMRAVRWREMRRLAGRYARFAWFSTPADLLGIASVQLIPLLVAYVFGATVAGWYALTYRIVALPMTVIGVAVSETYFGIAPKLAREDPQALVAFFGKTAKRLLLVGLVPTLVLVVAGPALFAFVFGGDWYAAGVYARYMAPALLAQLVASPLAQTANILERQEVQLYLNGLRTALVVCAFVAAGLLSWSADLTFLVFSAVLLVSYGVYFVTYWSLVRGWVRRHATPPA